MADAVHPPGWPSPRGYAHGMLASGKLLAVAGQIGADQHGRLVSDEFPDQFAAALANVLAVVTAAGGTAHDIVSMTVFVVDKQHYLDSRPALAQRWQKHLGRHYPAMTLVEVKGLVDAGAQVEIQALAVLAS
ncbi:MAG TPA: RidA family protein [Polyangia bacterium]|nr:RidA family protein [Polyangia bacterium]